MKVGSVCTGIGGLDLGVERAGMTPAWFCEIEPYPCKVLEHRWPTVPNHGDLKTIEWSNVEPVDILIGGYPCQPFALNGHRRGVDDPRHLWPWIADAVRVLRPEWALFENVPGHLSLGFDSVLCDLAALGFDVEWSIVSACAFGAPHTRERLYIVAHSSSNRRDGQRDTSATPSLWQAGPVDRQPQGPSADNHWTSVPQPRPLGMAHGTSTAVDRARLKAHGNAVVPQPAEYIARKIMAAA